MNEIRIINKSTFLDKEIDVWGSVEHPYFRAKDVVDWLKVKNVTVVIERVDEEEVTKFNLGSRQGETWFLTEDGLYEVLLQSRKPIAKQFKKGVKAILKEIRKTGAYVAVKEEDTEEDIIARGLIAANAALARKEARLKELEAENLQKAAAIKQKDAAIEQKDEVISIQQKQIEKAAPKTEYYDKTLVSADTMTTTQIADDLNMSARLLNINLNQAGIIYKQSGQWHLKGVYRTLGLAQTRTYTYDKGNNIVGTNLQLVWNQKGKRFILALAHNDFNDKAPEVVKLRLELQHEHKEANMRAGINAIINQ